MSKNERKRKHSPEVEENGDVEDFDLDEEGGTYVGDIYIPPPVKPVTAVFSTTRLIITKITNHFFKSYAHNVVLGPFSKCFNCIVGPNGSGKSNVIDSMLFVFGFRAAKLRSKKLSILIHNSGKYNNVQSCKVSVHFCQIKDMPGRENYQVVPDSEFVVSRIANKDNSSFYELNGRKVQFKEIAQLLNQHGIDLTNNRFLILQGEVEEIATMKPKGATDHETGMVEYLEDVIGTDRYKKPLNLLNEKLENLTALRLEKLNRVKISEKELEALKEPMQLAVDFLKTENKIATCQNLICQKNIIDLEDKVEQLNQDKEEQTGVCDALKAKVKEISNKRKEKEKELRAESGKYDGLKQRKENLVEAYNNADKKDMQLQADMAELIKNRKKYMQQLTDEQKKLETLQQVPQKNQKMIEESEKKFKEYAAKKEQLEAERATLLATLGNETKGLQEDKQKLETQLIPLKKVVDDARSACDLADSELKIYLGDQERHQAKLQQLRETVTNNSNTIKQRTEQISTLKTKITATEKSLQGAQEEIGVVRHKQSEVNGEFRNKRLSLEEARSSMQQNRSRGRVIDSLMQQQRQGNVDGVYGRLGDLGAIDRKYDVAISTACAALDYVVVDTADTAQWCIQYLKTNNIGRITFIALDKQQYLRQSANSKISTPENVARLFDLVKIVDDDVRPAFYYALGDTLVAEDLDQATRIAFGRQRFRVVTLRGDVFETSGTMSGGGRTVMKGRMGQSVVATGTNPKEIEQMETDLGRYEEKLRSLSQKELSLENQINTLEPELKNMKISLEKFTLDLQSMKKEDPLLRQQLQKLETEAKSVAVDNKKVETMTKQSEQRKKQFEKAAAGTQELQAQVNELERKISEKTTNVMRECNKRLNEVSKMADKNKAEITKLKVAITTAESNAEKSSKKMKNLEKTISDTENQIRGVKEQKEEVLQDASKLLERIEAVKEELKGGGGQYAELQKEIDNLKKGEDRGKLELVDLEHNVKVVNTKVDECNAQLHQWHAKLTKLKMHKIPNETVEELNKKMTREEIESKSFEQIEKDLQYSQKKVQNAEPNLDVIKSFEGAQDMFVERAKQLDVVTAKREEIKDWYERITNRRKDEFLASFNLIKMKLQEVYQTIAPRGAAELELVDLFNPFNEGIQLHVRPPNKTWKTVSTLSGGEKTLSSLALVFALHHYKPSPLYVMDEIDAALDIKNVAIIANYVKQRNENSQFIIISLRQHMCELSDYLIGIYKIFDCTRSITIDQIAFARPKGDGDKNVEGEQVTEESNNGVAMETGGDDSVNKAATARQQGRNSSTAGTADMELTGIQSNRTSVGRSESGVPETSAAVTMEMDLTLTEDNEVNVARSEDLSSTSTAELMDED